MRSLIVYLPALACGVLMLLICVPMMLGRKHGDGHDDGYATQQDIEDLREEIARSNSQRVRGSGSLDG